MVRVATEVAADPDLDHLRAWMLEQAETRGNAVISVAEGDGIGGYCFTAGAWRTHGIPEAVVIGLPDQIATVLLDAYVDRAATGELFEPGMLYDDFFEGMSLTFEHVAKPHYLAFFGSAFLLYPDGGFPAVQIIVPTPDGHWPWDADAPEGFDRWQPILTESGRLES